ncbi:relaxase domain-containing protein [Streptomyces sp. NPDC048304]|uniref:relaxase domain-containing protein n=1 Tax=Streptomyces sp. NPDC048304 TaxID=3154820 RepID=UPI0034057B62
MLTVRVLRKAAEGAELAAESSVSPRAFPGSEDPLGLRPHTMWVGSAEALASLGLQSGNEATVKELTAAVAGQHAVSGASARTDGEAFDLTFVAPTSVSWVWAQGDADLREDLEQVVMQAAYASLQHLTRTRPVIGNIAPAQGLAAALALHAVGQRPPWSEAPLPLLHVHGYLVGVLDESGILCGPDRQALQEQSMTRECGAVGRARLAQNLRDLGFEINARTGPGGRYFEIAGVPEGLLAVGRSADKGCAGLGRETDQDPWEVREAF